MYTTLTQPVRVVSKDRKPKKKDESKISSKPTKGQLQSSAKKLTCCPVSRPLPPIDKKTDSMEIEDDENTAVDLPVEQVRFSSFIIWHLQEILFGLTILFCLKSDRALSNISSPTSDPSQLVVCGTKATLFSRVAIIQPCTASFRFAFVSLFCAILFCDVIMTSHNDVINGSIVQYGWKYHIPLLSTRTKCLMSCSFYFTLSVGCIECANTETRFS